MRAVLLVGLALAASLTACSKSPAPNAQTNVQAVQIGNATHRCLKADDLKLSTSNTTDATGDVRRRLLTPAALAAGVRVYISPSEINNYGQVVIHYATANDSCLLWSESIPVQEYSQRLDLNPVGVSPFFEATPVKPVAPKPAATPVAAPTNK